jgi:mono/diheme cytochrome c family protein
MGSKYVWVWLLAASGLVIAVLLGACSGGDSDSSKFPIDLTGSRVAAGEEIYAQNCASCHGPVQGPVVLAAAAVHGDTGHTWHHPDRLLHQWVLDRPPLATVMPAFRGVLSDEQVLEVLAYIKSTWLPEVQERQDLGSRQYEAQVIEDGTE